jgi:phage terminase large subunit-like protein
MSKAAFMTEFQNEPIALEALLQWDWFKDYSIIPSDPSLKQGIYVDIATGESKAADYTAMSYIIMDSHNNAYIQDLIFGKWTGKQAQLQLEQFLDKNAKLADWNPRHVEVMIETVIGQRDFFQRIRDESWIAPKARSPGKRGEKKTRILYGLGQDLENGKVYLYKDCRNKTQLQLEVEGFDEAPEDHILDCIDQNIYFLKKAIRHYPRSGRTSSEFQR